MGEGKGVVLTEVEQAVFSSLLTFGEATRKLLAENTGFSFPTITVTLAELMAKNMVCELRREQGARGRATIIYGVSEAAGWVLGVDIGSTQIGFIARALNGKVLARESVQHDKSATLPAELAGRLIAANPVLCALKTAPAVAGVAINEAVPRRLQRPQRAQPSALAIADVFAAHAGLPASTTLLLENNVNCAAVTEHQHGMMRGHDDAAYMQIGVGIGLGFFSDGVLIRGGHGGSGELAQIPLSWHQTHASGFDALEARYGSAGLMQKAAEHFQGNGASPASPQTLFALAAEGNQQALALMQEYGVALGRIAATAATILDPTILVLGGGLVQNDMFARFIQEEFQSRNQDTQIEISRMGADATVTGSCLMARDLAISRIVDRFHRAICIRPTIFSAAPAAESR